MLCFVSNDIDYHLFMLVVILNRHTVFDIYDFDLIFQHSTLQVQNRVKRCGDLKGPSNAARRQNRCIVVKKNILN